jgi:cellulose synthase/poly-beta-1,6-N-acetylglucosamine synthase-like glycosyltransferase
VIDLDAPSGAVAGADTREAHEPRAAEASDAKRPYLFIFVFGAWLASLVWFHPRMWSLTELADGSVASWSIGYFVVFAELAWLYGFYNIGVILFAALERVSGNRGTPEVVVTTGAQPAVAILYTTCDDFAEQSALSCVAQDYPNCRLYLLDDSKTAEERARVDAFKRRYSETVTVIRRAHHRGFKAGNLNHALTTEVREPYFAIVDADEVIPPNFISRLLPRLLGQARCGFVQANHRAYPDAAAPLARDLGLGVDIHWKWYQPLRNRYGFVMFLGHGALLRRQCWEEVGGFPEIVSEDLAYAIALRERGYFGTFAEDILAQEAFPETVRAFRVRHVKWTRGTCEFLEKWALRLLSAKRITLTEKMDILFPTLNLPLTFFFFLFMANAAFLLPFYLGAPRVLTLVVLDAEFAVPVLGLKQGVERVFGGDFFAITLMTILAPILCFIIELAARPIALVRFLAHSTALYAALSPLTFLAVLGYGLTRQATFLVTGAAKERGGQSGPFAARLWRGLSQTHPDSTGTQAFEIAAGGVFMFAALASAQVSFIGVALGFALLPVMHRVGWDHAAVRALIWAPGFFIGLGILAGAAGVMGLQPVLFGLGFHF